MDDDDDDWPPDGFFIALWLVLVLALGYALFTFVGRLLAVGHFYRVLMYGVE